jgi:lysophospholipase L1-like esterase
MGLQQSDLTFKGFAIFTCLALVPACSGSGNSTRYPEPQASAGNSAAGGASSTSGGASAKGGSPAGSAASSGSSFNTGGHTVLEPEATSDGNISADNPRIQFFGRWHAADPKRPTASWGPVGFKARFEGTSISVLLEDEQIDLAAEGTGNLYQYSIDAAAFKVVEANATHRYSLATGLSNGPHELVFVRRTESRFGKSVFLGLQIDANQRVLDPGARPSRRIEVFGDSISAGGGNEDDGWFRNTSQNGYEAFGPKLARLLDAEWHVEARGGGSFFHAWLSMPPFFDKMFGPTDMAHKPPTDALLWDFQRYQPHVFILALGTNDWSVENVPHIDETTYVTKYKSFLEKLRGWYPSTEIFCLAPFKEGAPWDEGRKYIPLAVQALGDQHVHAIDPVGNGTTDRWLATEDYIAPEQGNPYHPNISGHDKIARKLEAIIRERMGW